MENILIIGGGAAGVSAALSLRLLQPDCKVTLWEKRSRLGGMADSRLVPGSSTEQYNYGVQGVHKSFAYSIALMKQASLINRQLPPMKPTALSAQFVADDQSWMWNTAGGRTNVAFAPKDVAKFRAFCKEVSWGADFYALMNIQAASADNNINPELVQKAILPTLALFFGTGQQHPNIPASIATQVFGEGETAVQIFNIDNDNFITAQPNMLAFPPLGPAYEALRELLMKLGVDVVLNSDRVLKFDGCGGVEGFTKVILCTQAEDAIKILPATHKAVKVLKHARYYDDVTVTHTDSKYMTKTFGESDQFNYYMKGKDTMGFALHKYQGLNTSLYQTIYLNTQNEPANLKEVTHVDQWRQTVLSVDHLVNCCAKLKNVQGPVVFFAGSYTLVNSHEVAIMSGIRAAQLALSTDQFPSDIFGPENDAYKQYKSI
jgi:predicted NAD/FAD-binding protein